MIKVDKGDAPETLKRLGPQWVKTHEELFDKHKADYLSGKRKMEIAPHVYGAEDVRQELVRVQHGKCCFCEVPIEHPYMHRHVEHWRPKGAVRQGAGHAEQYPGYYWLAYSWDNLFLACVVCNSSNKGTIFPVSDPSARARSHHDDEGTEEPQLLKPDLDDPADHLEWEDDQPRGKSPRGWLTVEVVGLIRPADVRRTTRFLGIRIAYERLCRIHNISDESVQEIADGYRALLRDAILPQSPFSAMAKAFLASRPPAP